MKRCSKCKIEKSLDDFHKDSRTKDGKRCCCKDCAIIMLKRHYVKNRDIVLLKVKEYNIKNKERISSIKKKEYGEKNKEKRKKYHEEYYNKNKEKLIEYGKMYFENNKERIIEYQESYKKENKDIILEKQRKRNKINYNKNKEKFKEKHHRYYENNKDKMLEKRKEYIENNIEKIREYRRKYSKEYKEKNREKLKELKKDWEKRNKHVVLWRSILKRTLNQFRKDKKDSTYNLLGYDSIQLKIHLENLFTEEMCWDNYGEWQVDHIKPLYAFDKNTHPSIVNSLSNLRPLWKNNKNINGVVYEGNFNRKRNKYYEEV